MQECLVAFAEAVAVVFHGRWRHWRIAEPGMPFDTGRHIVCDIAAGSFKTIVEGLLRDGAELSRRWRRSVGNDRVAAAGQRKR